MKKYLLPSLKLTLVFLIVCSLLYPLFISAIAKFAPGGGKGETLSVNGKVVGYANIGQKFTADKYFWSRPSAVDYNAAGSAGSNKGPTNPDYLKQVQDQDRQLFGAQSFCKESRYSLGTGNRIGQWSGSRSLSPGRLCTGSQNC